MTLPESIYERAEFTPVEDFAVALIQPHIPDIPVRTLIDADQTFPFVLVRRADSFGSWSGDHRFIDDVQLFVHVYCEDPDGDEDAALLSDAIRCIIRDAWRNNTVIPGRGHIVGYDLVSSPRRVSDWATSAGPVQYADLPTGVHRYETRYGLMVRRAKNLTVPTPTP